MKRIASMLLSLMMIFTLVASFSVCFAGLDSIGIEYTDGDNATMQIGQYQKDKNGNLILDGNGKAQIEDKSSFNWNEIFKRYKNVITGISGVAALTFLVFFIINFMKLGQSSGNPQMRSQALLGIVWCGIACAGLGGIAIFFGFFYNILQ